ncbi:MAG: flippase [Candidatus Sumerlaeaceae bacterium]|nr:flippase [Candidatus Sumerlaeaceae bacterium]
MKTMANKALNRAGFQSKIARNSIFLLGGEGLARTLNLIVSIILARHLGPERLGIYTFVLNYGVLLGLATEFGLSRAAIRDMARLPGDTLPAAAGNVYILRTLMCAVAYIAIAASLLTPLGHGMSAERQQLILLWALSLVFQAFTRNSEILFQSQERMQFNAAFLVLNRLIATALILTAIYTGRGLRAVVCANLFADAVVCFVANAAAFRTIARPRFLWDAPALRRLFRLATPFGLQLVATQIYFFADSIMIYYIFRGATPAAVDREIGIYGAVAKIVVTLQFIPISVCSALYPALSRAFHEDRDRMNSLFARSFNVFALAAIPLGLLLFSFRSEVIHAIYGNRYDESIPILKISAWSIPLTFLAIPLGNLLAASDRQRYVTYASFTNAACFIILGFLLIPAHGAWGAAVAMVAMITLNLALCLYFTLSQFGNIFNLTLLGLLAAVHATAIASLLLNDTAPLSTRAITFAVYLIVVVALGYRIVPRTSQP